MLRKTDSGWLVLACCLLLTTGADPGRAAGPSDLPKEERLELSLQELRQAIGLWNVVTEFINEDGTVAKSVDGTYEYRWLTPDRVASGTSILPSENQTSGLLFYVHEKKDKIEMVSVGPDGMLWIMTGPLGSRTRYSQEFDTAGGGKAQLRFTSYNVQPDSFESRMEYTTDGGKTWKQGNHQVFRRATD